MNFIKLHPIISFIVAIPVVALTGFVILMILWGVSIRVDESRIRDSFIAKLSSYSVGNISFLPKNSKIIYVDSKEYSIKEADINDKTGEISNQQLLISIPNMRLESPSYSFDGKSIAFVAFPIDEEGKNFLSNLYIANSDGSNPIKISSNNENKVVTEAVFSPDKKYLYFIMSNDLYWNTPEWIPLDFGIYSINLETKNVNRLTSISNNKKMANLSIDSNGKHLFFNSSILNLEDNSVKQIGLDLDSKINDNNKFQFRNTMYLIHSPDSNQVAFIGYMYDLHPEDARFDMQIFKADVATGKTFQLTDLPFRFEGSGLFFISPTKIAIYNESYSASSSEPVISSLLDFKAVKK